MEKYIMSLIGKVIDEIGAENVVQIVIDNNAAYKSAERHLVQKRKHLFWSPFAAHCLDLRLEEIGNMTP